MLRYNMGPADYRPGDWSGVAPAAGTYGPRAARRQPGQAGPRDPRRRQGSTIEA
jgi:hypothetical protein